MDDADKIEAFDQIVKKVDVWRSSNSVGDRVIAEAVAAFKEISVIVEPAFMAMKAPSRLDVSAEETEQVFSLVWRYHGGHKLRRLEAQAGERKYRCSCNQILRFSADSITTASKETECTT